MTSEWEAQIREAGRIAALDRSGLVGLSGDDAFDRLLELAIAVTGAPRGVIALVDAEHTTAISAVGFSEGIPLFAPIDFLFCRYVVGYGRPFLVEDAHNDPRTIGDPAIEAFAAVAWIGFPVEDAQRNVLGNFCLMDAAPREWSALDVQTVATLAQATSAEIALRAARSEATPARDEVVTRESDGR